MDCEKKRYQEYQKNNREYFREVNRNQYLNKVGGLSRRSTLEMTPELRRQYQADKANKRATRAKSARVVWGRDLTDFVYAEAHSLRKLRNSATGFEWHVDHVIPLRGEEVCGLHVWNNFAVIPKVENLRKGNKNSIHDQWEEGLQEGEGLGEEKCSEPGEGESEAECSSEEVRSEEG